MPDYQKMYHSLFNDVTDAITRLQQAQQKTEQLYIDSPEPTLTALPHDTTEKKPGDKKPIILSKRDMPPKDTPPKKKPPSHDER